MSQNRLEYQRRKTRRRWAIVVVAYGLGLGAVLGVLAERRWGWLPVEARQQDDSMPAPSRAPQLSMDGLSSRWSESAIARGWAAGGLQEGYFPVTEGEQDPGSAWMAPLLPKAALVEPDEAVGKIDVPNIKDLVRH